MTARPLFVTGTDTGVGKTLVAAALVAKHARLGVPTAGMKPVASGAHPSAAGLRSEDALALIGESNVTVPYRLINPYCFEPAIAPHIAARECGKSIELDHLYQTYTALAAQAEQIIVEGAGGWLTPLNERETLADFAALIGAEVVLVVGLRLGCINHALLTARAVHAMGLKLSGWIANVLEPSMPREAENIQALRERLSSPLIARIPYMSKPGPAEVASLL